MTARTPPLEAHSALADEASQVLDAASLAYVAIDTRRGPLVTPVLYGLSGRSTWFLTNRHAFKTKMLRRDGRVAWVVRGAEGSAAMTGTARLISPLHAREIFAAIPRARSVESAVLSWVKRNPRQVFGFLRDSVTNPMRVMPIDQVFVELRPDTTSFVQLGDPLDVGRNAAPDRLVQAVPKHLGPLLSSTTGVLAMRTGEGLVALPIQWDAGHGVATLPAGLGAGGSGGDIPACVTFDEPVHIRPTEQRGVVLRGNARFVEDGTALEMTTSRITYWDGFKTSTVTVPS